MRTTLLLILGCLAAVAGVTNITGVTGVADVLGYHGSQIYSGPSRAELDTAHAESLRIEQRVYLANDAVSGDQKAPVRLYLDLATYTQAEGYQKVGNRAALRELEQARRAFQVTPRTPARLLSTDPSNLRAEVRIEGGPHKGRTGWAATYQIEGLRN